MSSPPPPSEAAAAPPSPSLSARLASEAARRALSRAPVLPPSEDALTRRFLVASTTYFAVDVAHIVGSLAVGRRPRMWRGRLAHHIIQFVANAPALLADPPSAAVVRRYLILAYAAEVSTIVLRVRSLASLGSGRGASPRPVLHRALTRLLLLSFAVSRLINFPLNMANIWRAKAALPPHVWRAHGLRCPRHWPQRRLVREALRRRRRRTDVACSSIDECAVRWRMAGAWAGAELHRFRRSPVRVARDLHDRKQKGIKDIGSACRRHRKWDITVEYLSEPRRAVYTRTQLSL